MRAAGEADASALAALSSQLGYKATPGDSRHRLANIRSRGFAEVFVAERRERQVVGWVHVFIASSLDSDLHGEIGGLVVDDTVRGEGIGVLLLRAAEEWCEAQGLREIRVRSNVVRRRAHGFYNREGYADVKTQAVFRKELGTARDKSAALGDESARGKTVSPGGESDRRRSSAPNDHELDP